MGMYMKIQFVKNEYNNVNTLYTPRARWTTVQEARAPTADVSCTLNYDIYIYIYIYMPVIGLWINNSKRNETYVVRMNS